jgi:hypothetical protein
MTLSERFIDMMGATEKMGDGQQRSALGIVDSYLRGGRVEFKEPKLDEDGIPGDRDSLAMILIGLLDEATQAEGRVASHAARDFINAPYRDKTMNGVKDGFYERQQERRVAEVVGEGGIGGDDGDNQ